MPTDPDYGRAFVRAWREHAPDLTDLEAWDLTNLESADQIETLAFLRKEPSLGLLTAFDDVEEKSPAELALALASERRAQRGREREPESWGARFLRAYVELGGSYSRFSYAEAQTIKRGSPQEIARCLGEKFGTQLELERLEPGEAAAAVRLS